MNCTGCGHSLDFCLDAKLHGAAACCPECRHVAPDSLVTPASLRRADQIMQTPPADLREAIAVALAEAEPLPTLRAQVAALHAPRGLVVLDTVLSLIDAAMKGPRDAE